MNFIREHWSYLTEPGRYPGVDLLRALAVLLVLLYHFQFFRVGWMGVDIFFTISGFLIGGIIIDALSKRRFSLKEFYVRRCLRILPVYYFVVLLCILFKASGDSNATVATTSVLSSLFFLQTTGSFFLPEIFQIDYGYVPGGSWSLVVEEMFYLVAPISIIFMMKLTRGKLVWVAGLIFLVVISGVLSRLHFTRMYTTADVNLYLANFVQFHSRYDELAAGVAGAVIVRWLPGVRNCSAWLFVAGLCFSWLFFAYIYGKPGYLAHPNEITSDTIWLPTLMAFASTGILLASYWWPVRFAPVIVLARLSYPLYLIHIFYIEVTSPVQDWGFFSWMTRTFSFEGRAVISIFICVLLSYLVSLLIEYPFIRRYKGKKTVDVPKTQMVPG